MARPIIGKGTKVSLCIVPTGTTQVPAPVTLTMSAAIAAKDIVAPATITLLAALPAGTVIAAGNYLTFKDPITGKEVTVRLITTAVATDTTLTVDTIPEAIPASSVAQFPAILGGRTAANVKRSGKRQTAVDFDSDGYAKGVTTSIEAGIDAPGFWTPLDAGFATAEYAFENFLDVFMRVTMPVSSAAYSKGRSYGGFASVTELSIDDSADDFIKGDLSIAFNGKPIRDEEVPV